MFHAFYTVLWLSHGIENVAVATHEFFGTQAVVSALQDHFGFDSGLVEVQGVKRDTETNHVSGLSLFQITSRVGSLHSNSDKNSTFLFINTKTNRP